MRRFRRNLASRLFAASGVGCKERGGLGGAGDRSIFDSRATKAVRASSPAGFSSRGLGVVSGFESSILINNSRLLAV